MIKSFLLDDFKVITKRGRLVLTLATCRTDVLRFWHLGTTFNTILDRDAGVLNANRFVFY
jgi:hypothetical protein